MSLGVEKCKFFKTASNTRNFVYLGSLNVWRLLDIFIEHRCFSSASAVYFMRLEPPFAAWGEDTGAKNLLIL